MVQLCCEQHILYTVLDHTAKITNYAVSNAVHHSFGLYITVLQQAVSVML